jgi:pectinesterase inhibitor-like protein
MRSTSPVCILGLAVAVFMAAHAAAQEESCANPVTVSVACRGASDTHHGVDYDHCVRSLSTDPQSGDAAGIHDWAILATKLAIDHAASTESKISDLAELESMESDPMKSARYEHCLERYGGAADLLRDALDNLQAGVYGKALEQLMASLGASESCEDAWKGADKGSVPVAAHDREYGRMAHIAVGFTHAAA